MNIKITFLLFVLLSFVICVPVKTVAQSANCSTSTPITLTNGTACVNGSNTAAISATYNGAGCGTGALQYVWYTYTAVGPNNSFTVTPGTMTNPVIEILFTCPTGSTSITETCATSTGSTPLVTSWNMSAGQVAYIAVASQGGTNGTFQLCVKSTQAAPGPGNTCSQAIPICNTTYNVATFPSNADGVTPSCFLDPAQRDIWIQFTITQAGSLAWLATPNTAGTEYDWCLWDITGGCPGTQACCNYNFANGSPDGFGMQAQTGTVACGYNAASGSGPKEFCKPLAVTCGQTYAIQVSNYDNTNNGFTLTFPGSTCLINSTSSFTPTPSLICGTTLTAVIANGSTGDCAAVWDYGDGSATYSGTAPPNHTYNTPGTYEITETIGGACPSIASEPIQLLAPLAATATSTPVSCASGSCVGTASVTSVSGGDGIFTYSWNTGSTANNISGLCFGTYSVTVSNAKCGTSVTQTVSVTKPQALTLTPTPADATCGNSDGSILVIATGGTSPYTYSNNGGAFSGTTNYTALAAGTYTLAVKDHNGCDTTAIVTITESGSPTVTVTSSTICPGGTATLTANGATTYAWSAGVTPTTGSVVTVSPGATTSYTVTGTTTGCSGTATSTVTIGTGISVTVPSATICAGTSATLTATGGTTYTWTPGTNLSATSGSTVTANPTTTTIYTITGATGVCTGVGTTTVSVISNPTVSFSALPVCLGTTSNFTTVSTPAAGLGYSWDFGDAGTSAVNNPSHTYGTSNIFNVTLTVSIGTCTAVATNTVLVAPVPVASFTVGPVCEGTGSFFDASASTPTVGGTYNWSFGGASNPNTATVTVPTDTYTYTASGTFPVTLIVSVGSCSSTATGNAVVNPFPTLGFTANSPCDGFPVNFTNTTTNPATISAWHWDFDNDVLGGSDTSNVQSPSYTYTAPVGFSGSGCYPVILTATATTGCAGSFSATVNVHNNPFAYFNALEACLGSPSDFIDSSFVQNPACLNDVISTYAWDFGDGTTSASNTVFPDTLKHTYAACGPYNITLTVTTNNGCTNVNTLTGDTVFCLPVVTAPTDFSVCPGAATPIQTFVTTCTNGGTPFTQWAQFTDNTGAPNSYVYNPNAPNFNVVPSYNAITPNLNCTVIQDTVFGVAVSGVGCVGNETYYLANVYPTPTVTPMNPIIACANTTVNVPAFTGCPTPETFNWTATAEVGGNIGITSGTGDIASFTGLNNTNAAAITEVDVTPVANGCTGTPSSFSITINPIPVMTATGATVCPSTPGNSVTVPAPTLVTVPANPAAGVTFIWTATNNTNIGMAASGTGTPTSYTAPLNTSLTNQIGVVTYTPSLAGCIGLPASDTINIKPTPFMQPIADQYWCPFNMTNQIVFGTLPPSVNSTYSWSFSIEGIPETGATPIFPSVGPTSNGGSITLSTPVTVIPTLNGCIGPDSMFTIFVYPQPQANFVFSAACLGTANTFTDTSSPNTGNNAVTNWTWNFGNGQIGIGSNVANVFPSAGLQTVSLIVTTSPNPPPSSNVGVGCSDTITKNPIVNPNPIVSFYGDSVGCPPFSTQLHDNSSVPAIAGIPTSTITGWTWNLGNGNTSPSQNPSTTYQNTSAVAILPYSVSLTATTNQGCTGTKNVSQYIKVYPRPVAGFSWGPTDANIDDPTVTFVNQASGANPYTVTNQYGPHGIEYYLGDTYAQNDSVNYVYSNSSFSYSYINNASQLQTDDTAYYNVTQWVINQYGCTDSILKVVDIQPVFTFYIPNAFTPNGDGKNEGFKGMGLGIDNNTYNMWVFDRWGMMIYYATDINKAWDGHMRGNDGTPLLQEDVYVWKVQFDDYTGKQHQYHGTVTLLK